MKRVTILTGAGMTDMTEDEVRAVIDECALEIDVQYLNTNDLDDARDITTKDIDTLVIVCGPAAFHAHGMSHVVAGHARNSGATVIIAATSAVPHDTVHPAARDFAGQCPFNAIELGNRIGQIISNDIVDTSGQLQPRSKPRQVTCRG